MRADIISNMVKKYFCIFILTAIIFLTQLSIPALVTAAVEPVSCGDAGTTGKCGALGGCADGLMCMNTGCSSIGSSCSSQQSTTGDETQQAPPSLNIFAGPNKSDFEDLNPLRIMDSAYEANFASPAGIINRVLLFAFPLAGLILFVMIVWGGFEMVSGATNSKSLQAGQQRITAALIGFGLLFVSFWIIQIVEYIFNIAVL